MTNKQKYWFKKAENDESRPNNVHPCILLFSLYIIGETCGFALLNLVNNMKPGSIYGLYNVALTSMHGHKHTTFIQCCINVDATS